MAYTMWMALYYWLAIHFVESALIKAANDDKEFTTAPLLDIGPTVEFTPEEPRDIGLPKLNNSLDQNINLLRNRVTRIENGLVVIQRGIESLQVELKSLRKLRTTRPKQLGNYFDTKTGEETFTYDWYIDNVSQFTTTYQEDDLIKSPTFYIYPRGYRMFMATYPIGKSNLPTFSLDYLGIWGGPARGAYDSQLVWPFRLRFDLCIVDQTDDNPQNIETTIFPGYSCGEEPKDTTGNPSSEYKLFYHKLIIDRYQENVACGNPYHITRELLATRNYIKDDRILFRMKVYL